MEWKDVSDAIRKYAPDAEKFLDLASIIPGVGTVTGTAKLAIEVLSSALGTDPTPEAIHQAIITDPNAALKIKQADIDYRLKLKELECKELETRLADTQGARQAEVDKTKTTGKRDMNLIVMSWAGISVALLVFIGTVIMAILKLLDPIVAALMGNMSGIFFAKYSTIFDFWFGTGVPQPIKDK